MKTILLYWIILSTLAYANPFSLTKKDLQTIRNAYNNDKIVVRYKRFNRFLSQAKHFDEHRKLTRTNSYINKILPGHDKATQSFTDYWSTPKEFLIRGRGDCEDYAITKYFALKHLKIDKKKLYLAIVQVNKHRIKHMVLLYFKTPNSIPLVLDNLSWRTIGLDKRKDLTVKVAFNEIDAHFMKNNRLDKKVKIDWGKFNKWEDVLYRIYSKQR